MLYWAGAGLLAGWFMSRGLRGTRFGALATVVAVVVLVAAVILVAAGNRFQFDTLLSCLLFWITAQIGWFLGNLLTYTPSSGSDAEKAESPLG